MVITDPPPIQEPLHRRPSRRERVARFVLRKKWLNKYAIKALEAADDILSSIPVAEVAAELKDVALHAIKD